MIVYERQDVTIYDGDEAYRVHFCMGAYQVFRRVTAAFGELWEWIGELDEIMQQPDEIPELTYSGKSHAGTRPQNEAERAGKIQPRGGKL